MIAQDLRPPAGGASPAPPLLQGAPGGPALGQTRGRALPLPHEAQAVALDRRRVPQSVPPLVLREPREGVGARGGLREAPPEAEGSRRLVLSGL